MTEPARKQISPVATLELLTVERAKALLLAQAINRTLRERLVEEYARDIENGRWEINGETIKINKAGQMIDGQHRCKAVVSAAKPIWVFVVYDVEDAVSGTIDTGKKRTIGDVLSMRGEGDSQALAAALNVLWMHDAGHLGQADTHRPTHNDLINTLQAYPTVRDSIAVGLFTSRKFRLSRGTSIAFHCLFAAKSKEQADEFYLRLNEGDNLVPSSPIWLLRERLVDQMAHKRKALRSEVQAWIVKAWNAYRSGEQLKILRFNQRGKNVEQFPVIR